MISVVTIDFEASCLPSHGRSFPIEVGVADDSGWSRSWLIRPEPAWLTWTWTEEAQAIHGIRWIDLLTHGMSAGEVMRELDTVLGVREIPADHDLDKYWLSTLAEAAGAAPHFHVEHVATLLDRRRDRSEHSIQQALSAADDKVSVRHRAGPDALWLATFVANLPYDDVPLFPWADTASGHYPVPANPR